MDDKLLPVAENINTILKEPVDNLSAKITPSGREVVKLETADEKISAVRYPTTGKIVETIVKK